MTDAGERAREIVKDFPSWQYDTHGWFFCVWCFATTAKREVRYPDPKPGEAVAHIEPENPDAHNANCLLIDVPKRIAAALTDLETANAELRARVEEVRDIYQEQINRRDREIDRLRAATSAEAVKVRAEGYAEGYEVAEAEGSSAMLALIAERETLKTVVEAARRWKVRKGHGADGHQCDLCDALAAYDRAQAQKDQGER